MTRVSGFAALASVVAIGCFYFATTNQAEAQSIHADSTEMTSSNADSTAMTSSHADSTAMTSSHADSTAMTSSETDGITADDTPGCIFDCWDCKKGCNSDKNCEKMCLNINKACCAAAGKKGVYMMCGCTGK